MVGAEELLYGEEEHVEVGGVLVPPAHSQGLANVYSSHPPADGAKIQKKEERKEKI